MARAIAIVAETGMGKSYSIRNMDPEKTFIINVAGKDLPFPGYMKKYIRGKNLAIQIHTIKVTELVYKIATEPKFSHIEYLIIDDFQYLMADEFMSKAMEKGFTKFTVLGKNIYDLLAPKTLSGFRDNLNIAILGHGEVKPDDKIRLKTIGKLLDDKITLDGLFTISLHGVTIEEDAETMSYKFLTNTDGVHGAKSPYGMFKNRYIDNDLNYVFNRIKEYYEDGIIEE